MGLNNRTFSASETRRTNPVSVEFGGREVLLQKCLNEAGVDRIWSVNQKVWEAEELKRPSFLPFLPFLLPFAFQFKEADFIYDHACAAPSGAQSRKNHSPLEDNRDDAKKNTCVVSAAGFAFNRRRFRSNETGEQGAK